MKSIDCTCTILLTDGNEYRYNIHNGVLAAEFSYLKKSTPEKEKQFIKRNAKFQFMQLFDETTTLHSLYCNVCNKLCISERRLEETGISIPICVRSDNKLIWIKNLDYNMQTFINKMSILDHMEVFLIYHFEEGEIWRIDGIRYYMNSHESGKHNKPHIHIGYEENGNCASISIEDGTILAGNLPQKIYKIVRNKIISNKVFLLECWNTETDGLHFDINYSFGIMKIVESV